MNKLNAWLNAKGISNDDLICALVTSEEESVVLTGSLLAGYGDEHSDIDVYKIVSDEQFKKLSTSGDSERKFQQQRQKFIINYINVKGVEFDVEIHPHSKIKKLIDEFAKIDIDSREGINESFDGLPGFEIAETIELLNRLSIGLPLNRNTEIIDHIGSIPRVKLAKWMSERRHIDSHDLGKTFKRNLNKKEYLNAYIALTHRIDAAVDYVLFAKGKIFDRWKWRSKMVNSSKNEKMIKTYHEVYLCGNIKEDNLVKLNNLINEFINAEQAILQKNQC